MDELYKITGIVVHGDGRGRPLGFPTANISLTQKIPEGIYASEVSIKQKVYHAATFVGSAQTFEKAEIKLESYILDFDQDIYGELLTVRLYKKIRQNKKFDSVEALVAQMHKDVEEIREFFKYA